MKRSSVAIALPAFPLAALFAFASLAGCAVQPESTGSAGERTQEDRAGALGAETAAPNLAVRAAVAGDEDTCVEAGRYVIEDGVAVDQQNAGRKWQRDVDGELRTQPDAIAYCAALTLGGQGGWRLPTVQELNTLKLRPAGLKGGPDACYPSIDHSAFPNTPSAEFWSVTTRPAGDGLETGFDDGRTHPATLDTAYNVRCVHDGGPTPSASQVRADAEVTRD